MSKSCSLCRNALSREAFSNNQWKKSDEVRRCNSCITGIPPSLEQQDVDDAVTVGSLARIHGLCNRPDLNDAFCDVNSFDDIKGRFGCRIKGSGERLAIKPENLTRVNETDEDGVALGAYSCRQSRGNIMSDHMLKTLDPEAFNKAEDQTRHAKSSRAASERVPLLDAELEPRDLYRSGVRHTQAGRFEEACWHFMLAWLMDWSLNASDLAPPQKAAAGCPPNCPCAVVVTGVVSTFSRKTWPSFAEARKAFQQALAQLSSTEAERKVQTPRPATLEQQDRRALARCCAHIFLARFEQHSGPFSSENWAQARRTIARGIEHVDAAQYLCLQYELAYTARDAVDNKVALRWYDAMLANAQRKEECDFSPHWSLFFERVGKEARQVRFEIEGGMAAGGPPRCAQQ